jgi:hypothetical protein
MGCEARKRIKAECDSGGPVLVKSGSRRRG